MGRYFNPPTPEAVASRGGFPVSHGDYDTMLAALPDGFALGIHLDRYAFEQIADVTSLDEYKEFHQQVIGRFVKLKGFYAIPKDEFKH